MTSIKETNKKFIMPINPIMSVHLRLKARIRKKEHKAIRGLSTPKLCVPVRAFS